MKGLLCLCFLTIAKGFLLSSDLLIIKALPAFSPTGAFLCSSTDLEELDMLSARNTIEHQRMQIEVLEYRINNLNDIIETKDQTIALQSDRRVNELLNSVSGRRDNELLNSVDIYQVRRRKEFNAYYAVVGALDRVHREMFKAEGYTAYMYEPSLVAEYLDKCIQDNSAASIRSKFVNYLVALPKKCTWTEIYNEISKKKHKIPWSGADVLVNEDGLQPEQIKLLKALNFHVFYRPSILIPNRMGLKRAIRLEKDMLESFMNNDG
eukprot:gene34303-41518_t